MKFKAFQFNSSYLITEINCDQILGEYNKISLKDINLYYDKNVSITKFKNNNSEKYIVLLGYCFDIRNSSKSTTEILANLINTSSLYDELDYINGRYNLIIYDGKNHFIYSDASQLLPLVYHKESKSLSSHDRLLKNILETLGCHFNKRSNSKHTELDHTRYKEIFKFNPSLQLKYEDFSFKRFYPRTELTKKNYKDIFEELKPYLDQSIKYLENLDKKVIVTVTGGIDSRVSAALTRDFSNKVEYLTYTKPIKDIHNDKAKEIYKIDEEITRDMKNYLGWDHRIINLDNYILDKSEFNAKNKMLNSQHSYPLANYYTQRNYHKVIHVKSTVFSIGKADFSKRVNQNEDTFSFYKMCLHALPKNFKKKENFNDIVAEYFNRNNIFEGVTLGRHFFDLYHLESRMGNWHSTLTLETDPETDEFIFTNARKILDLIQQPSVNDRRNLKLYKLIIDSYWPVLLSFGINKPRERGKQDNNNIIEESIDFNNIRIVNLNKIRFAKNNDVIAIRPDTQYIKRYDQYSFVLMNLSNSTKTVCLSSLYSNKNARNKIKILIRDGDHYQLYDILDLNDGLSIDLNQNPMTINLYYNKDYNKKSWINAGKLNVKIID
jgi:hypothetical protein